MFRNRMIILLALMIVMAATACGTVRQNTGGDNASMANPASVFCEENGGKVEMRETPAGTAGVCVFSDGSFCDEWAYFRGECKPGDSNLPAPTSIVVVDGPTAESGWQVYQDEALGYRFEYPAGATISHQEGNPSQNTIITGPVMEGETWPMIYIEHSRDRAEFQVPEGTDLAQWLKEKFMIIPEQLLPEVQIAGTVAQHTRFEGSQQACPDDKFFFVHAGQLYEIIILHTGSKEDWAYYNHILETFQFER